MTKEAKLNFLINIVFYTFIAVIVYYSVKFLFVYLLPLLLGTAITVLVQKPAKFISESIKIKKGYCALILVILIYLTIIALFTFLLFKFGVYLSDLATSNFDFFNEIGKSISNISLEFKNITEKMPVHFSEFLKNTTDRLLENIATYMSDFAKNVAKSMPMFITTSVVTIIASCYIATDFDRFLISLNSVISVKYRKALLVLKTILKDNIFKLFIGYIKLLLITFSELVIGLLLLRVERGVVLALIISLLDLMPVFGTGTVLIPWAVYSIICEKYFFGIGLIILYSIISLVRSIIEPKIIGKQIGLHPLIALISVFIGLKLFGFIGIFIVPLSIMLIYKLFDNGFFKVLSNDNNTI